MGYNTRDCASCNCTTYEEFIVACGNCRREWCDDCQSDADFAFKDGESRKHGDRPVSCSACDCNGKAAEARAAVASVSELIARKLTPAAAASFEPIRQELFASIEAERKAGVVKKKQAAALKRKNRELRKREKAEKSDEDGESDLCNLCSHDRLPTNIVHCDVCKLDICKPCLDRYGGVMCPECKGLDRIEDDEPSMKRQKVEEPAPVAKKAQ